MFFQLTMVGLVAFAICAALIGIGLPYAGRLAIAVPNGRSSHVVSTPQSGGIFVAASVAIVAVLVSAAHGDGASDAARVLIPAIALAGIGWVDDRYGLPIAFRLAAYSGTAAAYVALVRHEPFVGVTGVAWIDAVLATAFLVTLINVTNFMDGIDGMIVVEFTPMLMVFGLLTALQSFSLPSGHVAIALAGALLGFFLFNRPTAKIFLGDSGSISIGFICGALLLDFAQVHGVLPALLLPLYFLVDAGVTLSRRVLKREPFWKAHRQHFYQRALDAGQSNWSIIGRVCVGNVVLCAAAALAAFGPEIGAAVGVMIGICVVGLIVYSLSGRTRRA